MGDGEKETLKSSLRVDSIFFDLFHIGKEAYFFTPQRRFWGPQGRPSSIVRRTKDEGRETRDEWGAGHNSTIANLYDSLYSYWQKNDGYQRWWCERCYKVSIRPWSIQEERKECQK